MRPFPVRRRLLAGYIVFSTAAACAAPIQIEGIADRQNVTGTVTFRVVTEAAYGYEVLLDDQPVSTDAWLAVTRPGYHQVDVTRTPDAGGASDSSRVRFNIYDPVRGSAEWGLFPWTPTRGADSASDEFVGTSLITIAPAQFPAQRPIPWIALIEDGAGHGKRLNGGVELSGIAEAPVQLKRGVGQTMLDGQVPGTLLVTDASVHELSAQNTCAIDTTTSWLTQSGDLSGDTIWPANGRIRVTGDLRIPVGVTLTVEAGCIVALDSEVDIIVDGALIIQGSRTEPAVFMPTNDGTPWGGFMLYQSTSRATVTGAIFVGSGAVSNWMSANGYDAHRKEQALFLLDAQSEARLRDVYIIESAGQAFHGQDATLTLDHVLVRECSTIGQFNRSAITIRDCALIDFPSGDETFLDADNDAMYFNRGTLEVTHTLLGWAKDDGIDAGGDGGGTVLVSNCWFEACFHEGMALSGAGKQISVVDTIFTQCGQGIETGYDSPQAFADHCLLFDNQVGLRFGDNYDWTYNGFLRATNCISIHNHRDIWNMCHDIWGPRPARADIQGNWQIHPDPAYPANIIWDPSAHAELLDPFIAAASTPGRVGIGFTVTETAAVEEATTACIPVALSMVSSQTVLVDYVVGGTATPGEDYILPPGTLVFPPGTVRQTLCFELLADALDEPTETIEIRLTSPVAGEVSAAQEIFTFTLAGGTHYVSPTGGHLAPFDTWATAATNLQAAIDVAADGASILATNGHFTLDSTLTLNKGVTLRSLEGPGQTTIDGMNAHRCFTLAHPDATLDGFTITRGAASSGAGVYIDGDGTVQNCVISSNRVTGSNGDGGGVTCYRGGTVQRCTITANSASDDAGGVYCYQGGRITDCVVTSNDCGDKGGGIYLRNGGTVEHCTVTGNNGSLGGGLYNVGGSAYNSIFYFNAAGNGANVYNSENATSYAGCCSDPVQVGAGNRSDDPGFVAGPVGDLRLQLGSACIDTGTAPGTSLTDRQGLPRPLDGNQDGTASPDIGAFEYLHAGADSDGDHLPDGWEWESGLDPTDSGDDQGADGDPDQDDQSNREEFIGDTNPLDARSGLAIWRVYSDGEAIHIEWTGGIQAIQVLERSPGPPPAHSWTPVFTNLPPTSTAVSHPISDAGGSTQLFRIRATRP